MYDTLLPHGMAKECLALLIEKGLNFLRVHSKLQESFNPFTKNSPREKEMISYI
jgi:hypothetical protein